VITVQDHLVKLSTAEFTEQAKSIVNAAQEKGVVLRITGSLGVYLHSEHSSNTVEAFSKLERLGKGDAYFRDLDLVGYKKQSKQINEFMVKQLGFVANRYANALFGYSRLMYANTSAGYHVDIFLDKMEYSHDVYLTDKRLEIDVPTISLADLVLAKAQIYQINMKDLIDLVIIFLGHDVSGGHAPESVDGGYISKVLSEDWGFWYDATNNLLHAQKVATSLYSEGKLGDDQLSLVNERLNRLISMINSYPKSKKWLSREKIGTRKPWYREVEEVSR
jgi:hypothetical protein